MDCREEEILFCNFVLPGNVQVIAVFSFRRQRLDHIYKNDMPTHEADLQDRFASEPVFVYMGRVISFLTHIPSLSEIVLQSPMYIQAEGGGDGLCGSETGPKYFAAKDTNCHL